MPATYPYSMTDRLSANFLNFDLGLSPYHVPPQSSHGGAYRFKQWIDTSVYPAMLRMCVAERASPAYVANQWATLASIYWGDATPRIEWGPQGGYLPLTGGTISGGLQVNVDLGVGRNLFVNGSIGIGANATIGGLLTVSDIHTDVQTVNNVLVVGGNLSVGGSIGASGNITGLGLYATYIQSSDGLFSFGLTIGQNLVVGNQISAYNIVTSYETIHGNLAVGNNISASSINVTNLAAGGNITTNTQTVQNNLYVANNITCQLDINAGRTVFATGVDIGNIIVRSPADTAIYAPSGGITALHGLFGNRLQVGSGDTYALWVPFGSATVRILRFSGPSGYDDQNFYMYSGAGVKVLNYSPGCYWGWNMSNGDLTYSTQGYEWFQLQNGSTYIVNKVGPFQAWNYLYLSDRRSKTNIVPSEYGLDAVLALNPVKFNRLRKSVEEDYPPAEIGFVAQDVARVIPEAVQPANVEFPDGTGGADSDEPALSLTVMPILGAMVEAFKQINARLAALEGAT